MCQYQGSVTQKNQSEVGSERIRELSEINSHISETKNREEYLRVINNYLAKINGEENWNNLSLCLRRYIYESFTGKSPKENPSAYSVHLGKNLIVSDLSLIRKCQMMLKQKIMRICSID